MRVLLWLINKQLKLFDRRPPEAALAKTPCVVDTSLTWTEPPRTPHPPISQHAIACVPGCVRLLLPRKVEESRCLFTTPKSGALRKADGKNA